MLPILEDVIGMVIVFVVVPFVTVWASHYFQDNYRNRGAGTARRSLAGGRPTRKIRRKKENRPEVLNFCCGA